MATLTQQEFLEIADLYPEGVNIWCTDSAPITVLGVTVPFLDNEGSEVKNILAQAQTITLPVDRDPGATVELVITSRVIRGVTPFRYYFFEVTPKNIQPYVTYTPTENETVQDGEVILLPNIRGGSFYVSDYNVTLNTAQNSRASEYILKNTSITFADVQDSSYSDTGWINARYEGTQTNNLTYATIDSAIRGTSLQGTYYPIQTPDTEIANIDVSERSYLEYFHTSEQTYPLYSLDTAPLFYISPAANPSASQLIVYPEGSNRPLKLYEPGDLIKAGTSSEIIKVVSIRRLTSNNDYNLEVIRGWNNTVRSAINNNTKLYRINPIRMFELEKSRPSPTRQGKVRLKDTGYIVYTDALGYVVSGSTPTI
jgi:hypothetical protein